MTELSQDEIVAQVEAELSRLQVADVLLHTVSTVASLAYRRLAEPDRDLAQVQLAIESLRALLPPLESAVPPELTRDARALLARLQLAYADAVRTV